MVLGVIILFLDLTYMMPLGAGMKYNICNVDAYSVGMHTINNPPTKLTMFIRPTMAQRKYKDDTKFGVNRKIT
jgi:hypothetical protein